MRFEGYEDTSVNHNTTIDDGSLHLSDSQAKDQFEAISVELLGKARSKIGLVMPQLPQPPALPPPDVAPPAAATAVGTAAASSSAQQPVGPAAAAAEAEATEAGGAPEAKAAATATAVAGGAGAADSAPGNIDTAAASIIRTLSREESEESSFEEVAPFQALLNNSSPAKPKQKSSKAGGSKGGKGPGKGKGKGGKEGQPKLVRSKGLKSDDGTSGNRKKKDESDERFPDAGARKLAKQLDTFLEEASIAVDLGAYTGDLTNLSEEQIVKVIRHLCGRDQKLVTYHMLEYLSLVTEALKDLRKTQNIIKAAKTFHAAFSRTTSNNDVAWKQSIEGFNLAMQDYGEDRSKLPLCILFLLTVTRLAEVSASQEDSRVELQKMTLQNVRAQHACSPDEWDRLVSSIIICKVDRDLHSKVVSKVDMIHTLEVISSLAIPSMAELVKAALTALQPGKHMPAEVDAAWNILEGAKANSRFAMAFMYWPAGVEMLSDASTVIATKANSVFAEKALEEASSELDADIAQAKASFSVDVETCVLAKDATKFTKTIVGVAGMLQGVSEQLMNALKDPAAGLVQRG